MCLNYEEFTQRLSESGFILINIDTIKNACLLNGTYGTYNCNIVIEYTPITHVISKIVCMFPSSVYWYKLKEQFNNLENALTAKYGEEHKESLKCFISPYYDGDGYEIAALRLNKCLYYTSYELEYGTIQMMISDKCCVGMSFTDSINYKLSEQECIQYVTNDI